jgi:maltose alpha-D-glucosyltransferase/alpha-amylase
MAVPTRAFRQFQGTVQEPLDPTVLQVEQSNTSVVYGNQFILKVIRRLEAGVNPELEVGRRLMEQRLFSHFPPVAGSIAYRHTNGEAMTLAILHGYVPNQGDAWQYTLDALGHYYEVALAQRAEVHAALSPDTPLLTLVDNAIPPLASELIGPYLTSAQLLGQRTAELHVALAQATENPAFAPEPFSSLSQRALYQSLHSLTGQTFNHLRQRLADLPTAVQAEARTVLNAEAEILRRFQALLQQKITTRRCRTHGEYHLGQVLYTGKDFVIIDFEGDPPRPLSLSERRLKRSPLWDVASMLRSFHYAACAAVRQHLPGGGVYPEDAAGLEPYVRFWSQWVAVSFLQAYLTHAAPGAFLPHTREELAVLLDVYLLRKAVYELGYELNHRLDWVQIPLWGLLQLLGTRV